MCSGGGFLKDGALCRYLKICENMFSWSYIWSNFREDWLESQELPKWGLNWVECTGLFWPEVLLFQDPHFTSFCKGLALHFKNPYLTAWINLHLILVLKSTLLFSIWKKSFLCLNYFAQPLLTVIPIFIVTSLFLLWPACWKTVVPLLKGFGLILFLWTELHFKILSV